MIKIKITLFLSFGVIIIIGYFCMWSFPFPEDYSSLDRNPKMEWGSQ